MLKRVPKHTWINIGIFILAAIVLSRLWRVLKRVNDLAPYLAVAVACAIIFLYWVYERTEPAFLTPFVNLLAQFLPRK
jgi:hypothetical protein